MEPSDYEPARPSRPCRVSAFCQRHHIARLALFGSVLRSDFRPNSDLDVLVEFQPGLGRQHVRLTATDNGEVITRPIQSWNTTGGTRQALARRA